MSHTTDDEELSALAALHALGALDEEEARDFEEHVSTCEACAEELRAFRAVAADLALVPPPAEPPAAVRSRLLALVSEEGAAGARDESGNAAPRPVGDGPNLKGGAGEGFLVVRAGEGRWRPTEDAGVSYKLLYADAERATITTLVRMEPGARIRPHRHLGVEQCLVLEGDVRSGSVGMTAGDFNCSLPGSIHEELVSDGGALLLLVSPERYEPVEPRAGS
jgi:anti-sigma factor ChrR (cupin superfamily)